MQSSVQKSRNVIKKMISRVHARWLQLGVGEAPSYHWDHLDLVHGELDGP